MTRAFTTTVGERCGFCQRLRVIDAAGLSNDERNALIDALFDQADRASRMHRAYGQRKGHR